ncbi:MAG TPA: prenyltransferase/squalene oxidase repeat-containing protein, partial [Chthoniobacteraceae bacterium]
MRGRFPGPAHDAAMEKSGGKRESELAVLAGLRWLKEHQNDDGSWGAEFKSSMSGLVLLCFLGHGEQPEDVEFGPTIKKAVDWMIDRGAEFNGRMSLTKNGWGGNAGVYQHAICTYAMGEYYSITQDDRIKDVLTRSVGFIVDGQNNNGGWRYNYEKGDFGDTSVTGWQVQALRAAHLTGLNIPGVDAALDKSMNYFKIAQRR